MSLSHSRNIGAYIAAALALDNTDAVAAGAGDATEADGNWVDRNRALSAKLVITFKAVLAEDKTLSIAANAQDASDSSGTGAADYGDAVANAVVATGGSGGSTERGVVELDLDLSSADAFIRPQVTPDLSAVATDTVEFNAVIVFGGFDQNPASL